MARPLRVLVVTDEMEVGGSQRQICHLVEELARRRDIHVELLYFREHSFLVDALQQQGVRVTCLPKRRRIDPAFLRALRRFLAEGRFDIVHAYSLTAECWITLAASGLRPRPRLVATVRGTFHVYRRWQWWIKRWVLSRADAVIANARAGADLAAARAGFPRERIDVIPNGVTLPAPAAREPAHVRVGAKPSQRLEALFVGRLVFEKGLPLLLDALASMPPARRPRLTLVGDGPLREELELQTAALGLDGDVVFLGARSDVGALMGEADFLVLPSREEGLSNVVMEAMAHALPVLVSDAGGNPELVEDGRTGLMFANGNGAELVRALERMVDDRLLRTRLGAAARARIADTFTIESMVRRTEAVYRRLLGDEAWVERKEAA
ncbi:glycosyl transferase group 1 [Mizugakiibacter sediminis]|uniref:Glycosyl transferase n=1 Tax=Mizugakiibacter sediminis TaxID=1475481 RepID=A0A0K8QNS7_9GAMM|nr:glycosyltransferase family 4 protein [Mizugakiibacter sediminis]GAP66366.1 glycosyl transferase group 1 [Mizugakiibacter sediminis]